MRAISPARGLSQLATVIVLAALLGVGLASGVLSPTAAVGAGVLLLLVTVSWLGISTEQVAYVAVGVFALTVTWNGIRVGGGALGDGPMALAFAAVLTHVLLARRPVALPPWLLLCAAGLCVSAMVVIVFPPSARLMNMTLVLQSKLEAQTGSVILTPVRSNVSSLIRFELVIILIPLMLSVVGNTGARCRQLLNMFVLSSVMAAASGILDHAGLHAAAPGPVEGSRSGGLTLHPNYLALTCAIALPPALMWVGRSRRWTIAGCVAVATLFGGEFASGSRAGAIATVLAVTITVASVPRLRQYLGFALPVAGMVVLALLLFTKVGPQVLHQVRLNGVDTSGSDTSRSMAANLAWTQIQARPLEGVGFAVIADAHDIYLEILAAGGVIAMTSFLIFISGLLSSAGRAWNTAQREDVVACLISVAVWLVNGVFDNQVADKYLYFVPGLLFALGHAARLGQAAPRADPEHATLATPGPVSSSLEAPGPIPA